MASKDEQAAIEEEFVQSWFSVQYFFTHLTANGDREWLKPLVKLIAELRERGHDRQLLAAQSMTTFILRRHRGHRGLPRGKPTLAIDPHETRNTTIHYRGLDGEIQIEVEQLEWTSELETLLARLMAHPID